jgi:methionine salvage enolase-phosphatase E1
LLDTSADSQNHGEAFRRLLSARISFSKRRAIPSRKSIGNCVVESVFFPRWKTEIKSLNLSESRENNLQELLIKVLAQNFTDPTEEEVIAMFHLAPFEETTVGKQIFGKCWNQGLSKGELIEEEIKVYELLYPA